MRQPLLQSPTVSAGGRQIGRPRKEPPADAARVIQCYAAEGRSLVAVALLLGTSRETLRRWMSEDPALQDAFDGGREAERHELHELMKRDARDGEKPNVNAMFLLKTRHGYRDQGDAGEQGARLSVTFNLPGALSRDEFLKTVVHEQ